jgi:hypothetical protein
MTNELSASAKRALINTPNRQGAVVGAPSWVIVELYRADLIGPTNGLTRKGTIARAQALSAALDAAF